MSSIFNFCLVQALRKEYPMKKIGNEPESSPIGLLAYKIAGSSIGIGYEPLT